MNLEDVLNLLYSHEINCSVSCFWDGGWDFRLGDEANGIKEASHSNDLREGAAWLLSVAKEHYPEALK